MAIQKVEFEVLERDLGRLEKLVTHYGGGNKSEFLRIAMGRLERELHQERFRKLREQVKGGLDGRALSEDEILALVKGHSSGDH